MAYQYFKPERPAVGWILLHKKPAWFSYFWLASWRAPYRCLSHPPHRRNIYHHTKGCLS